MAKDTRITIRLSETLRKELDDVCKMTGIEEPTIVRACLEAFVEQVKREGEIRLPLAVVPKSELKKNDPPRPGRQPISSTAEPATRQRAAFVEPDPPAHNRIAKSQKKEPAQ